MASSLNLLQRYLTFLFCLFNYEDHLLTEWSITSCNELWLSINKWVKKYDLFFEWIGYVQLKGLSECPVALVYKHTHTHWEVHTNTHPNTVQNRQWHTCTWTAALATYFSLIRAKDQRNTKCQYRRDWEYGNGDLLELPDLL